MKKQFFTLLLALSSLAMPAQVLNSSFENLNADGSIKNWGSAMLILIIIDSTGHPTDSLVWDNQFYFSTSDAHSGVRAMEMRNAYFYVSGQQLAGSAELQLNDSDYSTFSAPVPLSGSPVDFSFYYKFYPAGMDTAHAWMRVYDIFGNEIGRCDIELTGNVPNYTLASAPVTYLANDSAAYMEMGFRTAKPNSAANYGTRFLVDDVDVLLNGRNEVAGVDFISCFPNPAEDFLQLNVKRVYEGEAQVEVNDICGKHVNVPYTVSGNQVNADVAGLAPGVYIISIATGNDRYAARFIK